MAEDRIPPAERGEDRFPLYRRTPDGRHYYRIDSPESFTELQRVGNRSIVHRVIAHAYPERLRIAEMIDGAGGRYLAMDGEDWPPVVE